MSHSETDRQSLSEGFLQSLSALSGIELSRERAETIAAQAEQQFALMRTLDAIPVASAEPAGALRLEPTEQRS